MKKKLVLFGVVPALLLASCSPDYGKEVTDAKEVAALKEGISKHDNKDVKSGEISIKLEGSAYDEESKKNVTTKTDMLLQVNEKNEMYLHSVSEQDGEKAESNMYLVQNETYKSIYYVSQYDPEAKKTETYVYSEKENSTTVSMAQLAFLLPMVFYGAFEDPMDLDVDEIGQLTETENSKMSATTTYYSKGEGNLTMKIEAKGEAASDEKEETAVSENVLVTYDNYMFKSADIDYETNLGNKGKLLVTFTAKENIKIELPKGWEDLIDKVAVEE